MNLADIFIQIGSFKVHILQIVQIFWLFSTCCTSQVVHNFSPFFVTCCVFIISIKVMKITATWHLWLNMIVKFKLQVLLENEMRCGCLHSSIWDQIQVMKISVSINTYKIIYDAGRKIEIPRKMSLIRWSLKLFFGWKAPVV